MTTMSLTKINFNDLMLLEQLRIERLRSFFAQSLLYCIIRCSHKTLIIRCSEALNIDADLSDLKELCNYVWLILGVEAITLDFAQSGIYRTEICDLHPKTSG